MTARIRQSFDIKMRTLTDTLPAVNVNEVTQAAKLPQPPKIPEQEQKQAPEADDQKSEEQVLLDKFFQLQQNTNSLNRQMKFVMCMLAVLIIASLLNRLY